MRVDQAGQQHVLRQFYPFGLGPVLPGFLYRQNVDDPVIFDGIYAFAENGKVRLNDDGMIEFVTRDNFNGTPSF